MSSLTLSCLLGRYPTIGNDDKPLKRVVSSGCPPPPVSLIYTVKDVVEIHFGTHTLVYHAFLLDPEGKTLGDVVLKTDVNAQYPRPAAFREEALRYEKDLSLLQGVHIPRYYGLLRP